MQEGPRGDEPLQGLDSYEQMQRAFIQWLKQTTGAGNQP